MSKPVPFYDRTLDSFADDIITHQSRRKDGSWHAALDCSFRNWVSDPDFGSAGYGKTKEDAARNCARAIRDDAKGIGKYAPHSLLVSSYDLHYRLMRHWERKERFQRVGVDPTEMMAVAYQATDHDQWKLKGDWVNWVEDTRSLEFIFQLHLAEAVYAIRNQSLDVENAKAIIGEGVKEEFKLVSWRTGPSEVTWSNMDTRIDESLAEFTVAAAPGV